MDLTKEEEQEVQNTNLESHRSKRSLIEYGYREDLFLKRFGSGNLGIRSPAVNQGYLSRAVAIENTFERALLIKAEAGEAFQVLSCGAGFDSTYFRLKNAGVFQRCHCRYFEVDFPDSAKDKSGYILANPTIMSVCISPKVEVKVRSDPDGSMQVLDYTVIGCDLTKTELLEDKLNRFGFDFALPTLVIGECSLTYVESSKASTFYRWLALTLKNVHLFVYEQIQPQDRFGKIMTSHFLKRATPLKNVSEFPSLQDQERRMTYLGFAKAKATALVDIMNNCFGSSERHRRTALEPAFDELEEFYLKCSHYSILEACQGSETLLPSFSKASRATLQDNSLARQGHLQCHQSLWRYGHCAFYKADTDQIVVVGGTSVILGRDEALSVHNRLTLTSPPHVTLTMPWKKFNFASGCVTSQKEPFQLHLFGGRASPFEVSSDLTRVTLTKDKVEVDLVDIEPGPSPRWKHTLDHVAQRLVLIGGRGPDSASLNALGDIWSLLESTWTLLDVSIANGLYSHSTATWNDSIVISGGLDQDELISSNFYLLNFGHQVTLKPFQVSGVLPRFSHSSAVVGDHFLVLVGGISAVGEAGIAVINLNNPNVSTEYSYDFPKSIGTYNHALVQVQDQDKLYVIGGGGNCFSFGMHVASEILEINISAIIKSSSS